MSFNPEKDLVSVAAVSRVLVFLEANPSLPVTNVQEFIAYARANPGKLSFGSPGQGSSPHLAGEMLKRMAKIDATHVPTRVPARRSPTCSAASCSSGSTRAPASST
jgi:tripartite-type tricarboxylate transporter receptor subunit TctC